MVKTRGQASTEFIVMMAFLSVLGIFLMYRMTSTTAGPGASQTVAEHGAAKIQADKD